MISVLQKLFLLQLEYLSSSSSSSVLLLGAASSAGVPFTTRKYMYLHFAVVAAAVRHKTLHHMNLYDMNMRQSLLLLPEFFLLLQAIIQSMMNLHHLIQNTEYKLHLCTMYLSMHVSQYTCISVCMYIVIINIS